MSILILYASAGNGHRRAAQAIYEAFINAGRKDIVLLDILDFTPFWFKQFYSKGYIKTITYAKWLWRYIYQVSNRPSKSLFLDSWHYFLNVLAARSLGEYIKRVNVEMVISTHFMANDVVAYYKNKYGCNCRLVCIVTDYVAHRFWYCSAVDQYYVGSEAVKKELVSLGVNPENVFISGIPVPASFLRTLPKELLLKELGLEDKFTILMLANAVRKELIIDTIKVLMRDTQIIVGCGRNESLIRELEPLQKISNLLKIYGMIENMDYMMSVADVLVTKPGGLVVSEAIIKKLPMVLVDPIPGQEEGNRDYLVSKGVAIYADSSVDLIRKLLMLKRDKQMLSNMQKVLESMSSGDIAGRIVEQLLSKE